MKTKTTMLGKAMKKIAKGTMKKTGTFMGKSNKLGGGGRFKQIEAKAKASGATDPGAVAAAIGRKKYGKAKFQKMAAKGKKKAMK